MSQVSRYQEHNRDVDYAAGIIGGALAAYLLWQRKKIVENLLAYGVPEMVWDGVNEIEQATALRNRLTPPLEEVVEASVVKEATRIPRVSAKKPVRARESATSYYRRIKRSGYQAPESVVKAASGKVSELLGGTHWIETAVAPFNKAEIEMAKAVKEFPSNRRKAVEQVRKKLVDLEPGRVSTIAETEANGALNAGSQIIADVRSTLGVADTKTWLTMLDERVRQCHVVLHNVTIARNDLFNVCGSLAPHPGHWELPIAARIHCRCFLSIGGDESDIPYPLPEDLRIAV